MKRLECATSPRQEARRAGKRARILMVATAILWMCAFAADIYSAVRMKSLPWVPLAFAFAFAGIKVWCMADDARDDADWSKNSARYDDTTLPPAQGL